MEEFESKTLESIKNKGREEQLQKNLLKVLKVRLKKITKKTKERIMEIHQLKKLNTLFDEALKSKTIKEFEDFLDSLHDKE